jgi:hypothetical protein
MVKKKKETVSSHQAQWDMARASATTYGKFHQFLQTLKALYDAFFP